MRQVSRFLVVGGMIAALGIQANVPYQSAEVPEDRSMSASGPSAQQSTTMSVLSVADEGSPETSDSSAVQFDDAISKVMELEPKNYSYSAWRAQASGRPEVHFVSTPKPETVALLNGLESSVRTYTGASSSLHGLELSLELAAQDLQANSSLETFVISSDPLSQTIQVDVSSVPSTNSGSTATARGVTDEITPESVLETLPPAPNGYEYSVDVVSEGPERELTRGGVAFGSCTTAFAVSQGGSRGVLTAGHCPNYRAVPAGTTVGADYPTEHRGRYGDSQWHSTTDTTTNVIRNGSSSFRTITGQGIASLNSQVCNYGKTRTSASCGTVKSQASCVQYKDQPYMCRLVVVRGSFTNPGDSGGPWYISNSARGIHSGSNKTKNEMFYTRIGSAQSMLGVALRTN